MATGTPSTYSHRNGETVPPTIVERFYWFSADDYDWTGLLQDLVYVMPADEADVGPYIYYAEAEHYDSSATNNILPLAAMKGQWWGPVTPPWELTNGA